MKQFVIIKLCISIIFISFILLNCTQFVTEDDDDNNSNNSGNRTNNETSFNRQWTIMVWMDADNDLERTGAYDINEMEYGLYLAQQKDPYIQQKISIIVQFDRIDGYDTLSHDDGQDWTDTRRYLVKPDENSFPSGDFTSEKLNELGEVNMGDASELKSFIAYCKSNYKATYYMLVFWNHGAGVRSSYHFNENKRGFCVDDTNNQDLLYTGEITDFLTKNESVDIICFDTCSMGMTEVAYEYRPGPDKFGADYMIASPAEIPFAGQNYVRLLSRLQGSSYTDNEGDICFNTQTLLPDQLVSAVVKEYRDEYSAETGEMTTALDLAHIVQVKEKLDLLAVELVNEKADTENIRGSSTNTITMEYFSEYSTANWLYVPNFDMYDFARRINASSNFGQAARDAAAALLVSIDDCVNTSWAGQSFSGFLPGKNGLGFFFPDGDREYAYNKKFYQSQWWYTSEDTYAFNSGYYGKLDFCNSDNDGIVEGWRELLEYWYDNDTNFTPSSF